MKRELLILSFILIIFSSGCVSQPGQKTLKVYFPDLREAILIETPNGKFVMIDSGEDDSIIQYLHSKGVQSVEFAVLTHPHEDHYKGFVHLLPMSSIHIKKLYHNRDPGDEPVDLPLAQYMMVNHGIILKMGDKIELDGVTFEVLWPETNDPDVLGNSSTNENSIVIKMTYGETSFLFTGDCAAECSRGLIASGRDMKADVLKLGHHGDPSGNSLDFLDAVDPDIMWLSFAGIIPDIKTYEIKGQVLSNFANGEIIMESDGKTIEVTAEKEDRERERLLEGTVLFTAGGKKYAGNFVPSLMDSCEWMDKNTNESAKFLSWWDYGPTIMGYCGRDSVIYAPSRSILNTISMYSTMSKEELEGIECPQCMDNEIVEDVALALTSENTSETIRIMEKYGVEYLLVNAEDNEKGFAIFTAAGMDASRYFDGFVPNENVKNTTLYRMILGSELEGFENVYNDKFVRIDKIKE